MARTPLSRTDDADGSARQGRASRRRSVSNTVSDKPLSAGAGAKSVKTGRAAKVPVKADRRDLALPEPVLPDPVLARMGVEAAGSLADRLGQLSIEALAETTEMNQRWARETTERLAALARPPERPEDLVHGLAGFLSSQGDLATQQFGRAAALVQRFQVETMGALAEAGRALADEAVSALHDGPGRYVVRTAVRNRAD